MKTLTKAITTFCAVAALSFNVNAANYRLATNVQENSTAGTLLKEFAGQVKERTDGRVNIRIFSNGVLGSQLEYFQNIQRGVIDMGLVNSAALENAIPAFGVVNLPYMFRTADEYGKALSHPDVREALFQSAAEHRFVPLGFLSNGFRSIYTTREVNSAADLKGMKLRTMSSDTYIDMLDRFGAVPTPLAYSELFTGLQQGVVDGAEGGLAGLWENKFGEVAKYAIVTEQTRLTDFVVSSNRFQEKVGKADLKVVQEEFDRISARSLVVADENEANAAKLAESKLGVRFIKIDKQPLMDAVKPMYEQAMLDEDKKPLMETIFRIQNRNL